MWSKVNKADLGGIIAYVEKLRNNSTQVRQTKKLEYPTNNNIHIYIDREREIYILLLNDTSEFLRNLSKSLYLKLLKMTEYFSLVNIIKKIILIKRNI